MNKFYLNQYLFVLIIFFTISCLKNENGSILENENLLSEDTRYHFAFTEEEPVFGVSDMCMDDQGRYYLVYYHQKLLATVNPAGSVDGYLISPGRGPGDIDAPIKIYCYEDGANVLEMGTNARVQTFSPNLANSNIMNVLPGTFDFSKYNNRFYISANSNVQGKFMTLHILEDNQIPVVSAYEDPDYPVYTFSQTNFHGTIAAWHMFENTVKLFDSNLQHLKDVVLPYELYQGIYQTSESFSIGDITSKPHPRIAFASATDSYFVSHIRTFNSPDAGKIVLYLFDENKWIYQSIDEDINFFQHNEDRLFAYKFYETPYGELTVFDYILNLP
jgi:hypothetical protein